MSFFRNKKMLFPALGIVVLLFVWYAFGDESEESTAVYTSPQKSTFKVDITTTGELRAKNSTSIRGPERLRELRVYKVAVQRMVDEGTVVKKGDFVASLDRSEINTKLQDEQLELKEDKKSLETAKLDSSLELSSARDNIVDLEYSVKEAKIKVEQSKYESPAQQRQVKNDFEKTKRSLEQARKSYKTKKRKAESNVQQIQTELQQQRRKLNKIKETIGKFNIRAPENGMVIYKRGRDGSKLTEGDQISAWDPVVAKLPDFSVMNSVTYVNEVDIQKVKVGQKADIGLDAMPEKKLSGRVTKVANIGEQRPNSDSKVFKVTVEINESDSTLRPSMTTSNTIHVNSVDSALHVPLETIHATDSLNYVFKSNGMNVVRQQVVLGMMNSEDVIIRAGLSKSDRLYLSTPEDTSGISKSMLSEEVLKKYQPQETDSSESADQKQKKSKKERMQQMMKSRRSN